MRLVADPGIRRVALAAIRALIQAGLAGRDYYDLDTFVVDVASQDARDDADVALDALGASFLRDDGRLLRCVLPGWASRELGLDLPNAPTLVTALASRAAARPATNVTPIGGNKQ